MTIHAEPFVRFDNFTEWFLRIIVYGIHIIHTRKHYIVSSIEKNLSAANRGCIWGGGEGTEIRNGDSYETFIFIFRSVWMFLFLRRELHVVLIMCNVSSFSTDVLYEVIRYPLRGTEHAVLLVFCAGGQGDN